jgi:sterol 3beta-glucosyltransferase
LQLVVAKGLSVKIGFVAIDTRGGVQPYAALALGLRAAGHEVRVVAPEDSLGMLIGLGLDARALSGSMREDAKLAAGTRGVVPRGVRGAMIERAVLRAEELLEAADGLEVLSGGIGGATIGVDVAEKLGIPFVHSHLQPVGFPSRHFPGVLAPWMPAVLGAPGRRVSHAVTALALTVPFAAGSREVRRSVLGLPKHRRSPDPSTPILYGFSPYVVPPPPDWPSICKVTGYWFLPPDPGWAPPVALAAFLDTGPPPVAFGFGSMSSADSAALTETVVAALRRSGQRAVLLSGWGGLEDPRRDDIYVTEAVPHDWLFPRVSAVVHHGGAGTTAAALRAGLPAVIVPFAVDQPFWGMRVAALGAGPKPISQRRLTPETLSRALIDAIGMREAAADLGRRIRAEDGVATAVTEFERIATAHA